MCDIHIQEITLPELINLQSAAVGGLMLITNT